MLIWGLMYPATKYVLESIDAVSVAFARYSIATVALLPFFVAERRKASMSIDRRDAVIMSLLGVIGVGAFSMCITFGIKLSTAANSALLVNTQPILTALLAPVLIGESTSRTRTFGGLFGLIGIYLLVSGGAGFREMLTSRYLAGNAPLLAAALLFSIYSIFVKAYVSKYGGLTATFFSMAAGTVVLIPVLVFGRGPSPGSPGLTQIAILLYVGVVATAVANLLLNQSFHHLGVVRAMGFKFLIPVFGFVLSVILLKEAPSALEYVGAGIVVVSVLLTQRERSDSARRT